MIIVEILNDNFIKQYSNKNVKIKQLETGILYDEAIDLIPCKYSYEETEEIIPIENEEEAV